MMVYVRKQVLRLGHSNGSIKNSYTQSSCTFVRKRVAKRGKCTQTSIALYSRTIVIISSINPEINSFFSINLPPINIVHDLFIAILLKYYTGYCNTLICIPIRLIRRIISFRGTHVQYVYLTALYFQSYYAWLSL
jgi:hypothetical protein